MQLPFLGPPPIHNYKIYVCPSVTLYLYPTHFTYFGPLYSLFVGPAYQGRDFVSRIIIEYECFKQFGPNIVAGCPFFQSHESNFDKCKVRFCTHNLNENAYHFKCHISMHLGTWASCYCTIQWIDENRWIDFVKIKFHLNDLILNEFT